MEPADILYNLANLAPVVAVLIYFIFYFRKELDNKNDEIKELNNSLRENQKETIITLNKLIIVIEDLKEVIKDSK